MDLDQLKKLLDLMNQNQLTELELEESGLKVRLRKGGHDAPASHGVTFVHAMPPALQSAPAPAAPAAPAAVRKEEGLIDVKSPLVGTLYRAPKPDMPPFVEVGAQVKPDTTLCVLEAMKVMNEIKAEVEGEIREILVKNGEPVEFGQTLFRIKKTR